MNSKGISPLIATLLLLSFAIAIGVVVMNFGRAQVELEASCPVDIGLDFLEIGGQQDICYDGSQVRFTVENGVNVKITGLVVNVIGTEKAETFQLSDAKIVRAGTYLGKVEFTGQIRQVKITPKMDFNQAEEICVEKALVVENLRAC